MPDRHEFLDKLEDEMRRRLPPVEAVAFIKEAREHLEESIQARLELGATPEEAEREALAAFGQTHVIGKEARRREPCIDRPFLLSCLALVAFWAFVGSIRTALPEWGTPLFAFAAVGVHAAYIVASVYARRLQVAGLLAVFASLGLGWGVFQAATHVYVRAPGGDGAERTHRDWVTQEVQSLRDAAARERRNSATLVERYAAFVRGDSSMSPSRAASFTEEGALRLFRRATRTEAATYWQIALDAERRYAWPDRHDAEARATEESARAPWWPNVPAELALSLGEDAGAVAATYGTVHLAAWLMGQTLLRRRKRRNGTFA